ncbi:MAG: hypothetical protein EBX63_12740, partial [Betaproteobacteria bacterium]|nr:hypothetical protein [Betaproteobacteria bacterium]
MVLGAARRVSVHQNSERPDRLADAPADHCSVTINIDGKARKLAVPRQGPSILQMGLLAGMPLPFACQAAVCC